MKREGSTDTMIMVGIALLVLAGVMVYMSLSSPRVYEQQITTQPSVMIAQSNTIVAESNATVIVQNNAQYSGTQANSVSPNSVSYPIDLNTATMEQLQSIDGIGEGRAYQIIAYREHIGAYTSVDQIKDIKGIGDSLYSRVAPYLTV